MVIQTSKHKRILIIYPKIGMAGTLIQHMENSRAVAIGLLLDVGYSINAFLNTIFCIEKIPVLNKKRGHD
jgi:hypothetical protein